MSLGYRLLLLGALLSLPACTDWNELRGDFPDRAAYAASEIGQRNYLPTDLLPPSARNIRVVYNRDTTMVESEFDFAAADREVLVQPFLSFDQRRLRIAVAEGEIPAAALPTPSLFLRCGPGPMEFLKLDGTRARYWTDVDRKRREEACTNRAASGTS